MKIFLFGCMLLMTAGCPHMCKEAKPGYSEFIRECLSHIAEPGQCYWHAELLGLTRDVECEQ